MATQVTVAMTFKDAEGNNESGTVEFRLTHPLLDSSGNLIASQSVNAATLASGAASITLYATNDPTTTPDNLTYEVTEKITGSRSRRYEIELDYATTSVRLEDLSPVSTIPPVYSYALSSELAAIADDYVDKAGDTMTGGLTIASTIFDVRNYGTVDLTGSTDSTTAVQAAITAAAAVGGTVVFPAGTIKLTADLTFTNNGGTPAAQRPVKLLGAGATQSANADATTTAYGGTIINYSAGTNACLDTRGAGLLEVTGITFTQTGTAHALPYVHTTNTVLHIHDCSFLGHSTKQTTSCNQDAIVLGGTTANYNGSAFSDAFQGYGTVIESNHFNRIRAGVLCQVFCNGPVIQNNTFWAKCGSDGGSAAASKGAIHFDCGGVGTSIGGATVTGNVIECIGYYYGIKLASLTFFTNIHHNGFYDEGGSFVARVRCDSGAQYNLIAFNVGAGGITDLSDADGTNRFESSLQSVPSVNPNPVTFSNTSPGARFTGLVTFSGGNGNTIVQPATVPTFAAEEMIRVLRASGEGANPGTRVFGVTYGGDVWLADREDANTGAKISNGGKTWTANGTGGAMLIDSGTGGSYVKLRGYGYQFQDHTQTYLVSLRLYPGSPAGALSAASIGDLALDVSNGDLYIATATGSGDWKKFTRAA